MSPQDFGTDEYLLLNEQTPLIKIVESENSDFDRIVTKMISTSMKHSSRGSPRSVKGSQNLNDSSTHMTGGGDTSLDNSLGLIFQKHTTDKVDDIVYEQVEEENRMSTDSSLAIKVKQEDKLEMQDLSLANKPGHSSSVLKVEQKLLEENKEETLIKSKAVNDSEEGASLDNRGSFLNKLSNADKSRRGTDML